MSLPSAGASDPAHMRSSPPSLRTARPVAAVWTCSVGLPIRLSNVWVTCGDFVEVGTGLPDSSIGYAMLFNILHCEQPNGLLREAWRVLAPGGTLAVMHWNYDPSTPRGPSMDIRPRSEQCRAWAVQEGFEPCGPELIDLPPYHYGLTFHKPRNGSQVRLSK